MESAERRSLCLGRSGLALNALMRLRRSAAVGLLAL
jgi:hypothetical protein